MGNGDPTIKRIGMVQPNFERAEISEIREKLQGRDWAVFRVPVVRGDDSSTIQILDCRPDTLKMAEAALAISTKYRNARGKARKDLETERLNALRAVRTALNDTPAEAVTRYQVLGGGKSERISIILYPTEEQPEQIMALVHTAGWYSRLPFDESAERPMHYTKGRRNEQKHFHAHLVVTDEEVKIWQMNEEVPMLFKISLENGVEAIAFKAVPKPEEPELITEEPPAEPAAEPGEPTGKPETIERSGAGRGRSNGDTSRTIDCSNCETPNTVKRTAKKPVCARCKTPLPL